MNVRVHVLFSTFPLAPCFCAGLNCFFTRVENRLVSCSGSKYTYSGIYGAGAVWDSIFELSICYCIKFSLVIGERRRYFDTLSDWDRHSKMIHFVDSLSGYSVDNCWGKTDWQCRIYIYPSCLLRFYWQAQWSLDGGRLEVINYFWTATELSNINSLWFMVRVHGYFLGWNVAYSPITL